MKSPIGAVLQAYYAEEAVAKPIDTEQYFSDVGAATSDDELAGQRAVGLWRGLLKGPQLKVYPADKRAAGLCRIR